MAAVVEVAVVAAAVVAAVVVNRFAILSIAIEPIAGIEMDAGVVTKTDLTPNLYESSQ